MKKVLKFLEKKILYLMILPATFYFLLFSYLPMMGIVVAFKQYSYKDGIFGSPWNGLNNFKFFLESGQAWNVTRNTLLFNIAFIGVNMILQIGAAIILSELIGKRIKKVMQSMMFLPYFLSWVVVGAFVYNIFNYESGFLNTVLQNLGFDKVNVYMTKGAWKYILIFFKAWKDVGYGSVLYLAAITGIDQGMYEAAEIDGANIFKRIRYITLPSLKPTMVTLLLLNISNIFRGDFQMFYNIIGNNGMLYKSTDVIDTFVFRSLMRMQEFGMSAATGLYQSVLCFAIILSVNKLVKSIDKDYGLF